MLVTRIAERICAQASLTPWTNVYGLGRSLVALGSLLTLLFSHSATIFRPTIDKAAAVGCEGISGMSLYCQVPGGNLELARWIAAAVLLLVVIGWRPRFTGVAHWYVVWSFMVSGTLIDGGDQIAAVLSLLLIPVTLMDPRRSHWGTLKMEPRADGRSPMWGRSLVAQSFLWAIRLQVAVIYFHAATAKFAVEEWLDGTVLYYWFTSNYFGAPDWLMPAVSVVVGSAILLPLLTWSVLVMESLLASGLVAAKQYRPAILLLGVSLHLGIALVHGIVSFSVVMFGALVLFLRPFDEPFSLDPARRLLASARRRVSRTAARPEPLPGFASATVAASPVAAPAAS